MLKDRFSAIIYFIFGLIRRDIRTKGAILLVGIILWFSINLEKNFETTVSVPIRIINLKKGMIALNSIPKTVKVIIKGKGKELFFSDIAEFMYFEIDLSNVSNKKNFKINKSIFVNNSSENIELISVLQPLNVEVELDFLKTKFVPVVVRSFYTLKIGYLSSGKTKIIPESVLVSGPLGKVKKITCLYSEEFIDSNLTKNWNKTVKLLLPDTPAISYSHSSVKIMQKISKKGTNSFKCLVRVINAPENKEIVTDPVSVVIDVFGAVDDLYNIDQKDFSITADFLKLNEFDKTIPIEVKTEILQEWKISDEFIKVVEL